MSIYLGIEGPFIRDVNQGKIDDKIFFSEYFVLISNFHFLFVEVEIFEKQKSYFKKIKSYLIESENLSGN